MAHVYDLVDPIMDYVRDEAMKIGRYNTIDLPMASVANSYVSCGVSTLWGLSQQSPKDTVERVLKERDRSDIKKIKEAFVVFSDADYFGHGRQLYEYIKENNLGNITEFGPRRNPNTGNMIRVWVWEPPHADLIERQMPVKGKIMMKNHLGQFMGYEEDPKLQEKTNMDSYGRFHVNLRGA